MDAFLTIRRPSRHSGLLCQICVLLALWCPPNCLGPSWLIGVPTPGDCVHSAYPPGRPLVWRYLCHGCLYSVLFSLYVALLISAARHIMAGFFFLLSHCMSVAKPWYRTYPECSYAGYNTAWATLSDPLIVLVCSPCPTDCASSIRAPIYQEVVGQPGGRRLA